jgi:aspartyl-tRNA(Asn)/glutamyl-tRNA(Gln) amidotransferase subunit A
VRPRDSASTDELPNLTLLEASELLRSKVVSPVALTEACLARIEALNPKLNAFITITADTALEQARQAESEIQQNHWRGPLHGIPIALKDLFDTAGVRTTAGSQLFLNRVPQADAEAVRRLKLAGAVFLGKLNLHEFAYGGSGIISYFGPARNPANPELITGGSSSGSAAAVAAGMCYAALGTDTAGSIRLPAAYCGVVGLKPTFDLVSTEGVIPLAWSYDHVGPLSRTVADAAAVLQVIADDSQVSFRAPARNSSRTPDYTAALTQKTSTLRLGIARSYFFDDLHPEVAVRVEEAISVLTRLTAELREISLPIDTDRTVANAEEWCYHEKYVAESPELYQPETLRRLRAGANISAGSYITKKRELDRIRRENVEVFSEVDLIITPTSPIPADYISELQAKPEGLRPRELLMLRNTRPLNVWGFPTISLPCGRTSDGRFVGLQISGRPWDEATVLALAHAYERTRSG